MCLFVGNTPRGYKKAWLPIFNMAALSGSSGEDMTSGQDAQSALLELDKGFLHFLTLTYQNVSYTYF